jgi:hypothetical protein
MAGLAVADHSHRVGAPPGVSRPRRPRASPLYGLLDRRFRHLSLVYDERFAPTCGPWHAVIPTVVDRFLACGLLEHGFTPNPDRLALYRSGPSENGETSP